MPFFEVEYRVVDPSPSIEYLLRDLGISFEKRDLGCLRVFEVPERGIRITVEIRSQNAGFLRNLFKEIKIFRLRVESEDKEFLRIIREKLRIYMLKGGG
jgi:hypothetical protein